MVGYLRMLVRSKVISTRAALAALDTQRRLQTSIGDLAIQNGLLTQMQVLEILETQQTARRSHSAFGQIAIELGLLTPTDVASLLEEQHRTRPSLAGILANQSGLSHEWLSDLAKTYSGGASESEHVIIPPQANRRRASDVYEGH